MNKGLSRVVLAGTHSGVGKTTITMGLLSLLKRRGILAQPYKVGPDYIDSGFHSKVSGRACCNLDSYLFGEDALRELFSRHAQKASISLIEGVMGLYDGLAEDPKTGSTADVAKILRAPVVLVVDAGKISASAGAIVLGYKAFDPFVDIAACIINRVSGYGHYRIVQKSIEEKSKIKVLGYLPKDDSFVLRERHLGLRPAEEINTARVCAKIAKAMEKSIDIPALVSLARKAPCLPRFKPVVFVGGFIKQDVSIAVARDKAFNFYYRDNLDILEYFGARLKFFSPLKSKRLPEGVGGVYIGGGFPEMFAKDLSANKGLLKELKKRALEGMPIYAECAGLIYLMKELSGYDKSPVSLVGVFPGKAQMGKRLRMFGYYEARAEQDTILAERGSVCKGHIFHWSYITGMPSGIASVFRVKKGERVYRDGYARYNTLAAYLHFHFASNPGFAKKFIESCRKFSEREQING